jgi:hypothetical protein
MKIQGAYSFPSINYALNMSGSGRMSVPVNPASLIYSQFKHVSGIPAPEGTGGVTISRINILDVLIGQLAQIKKQPESNSENLPNDQLDALISKYEGQIKAARDANRVMPYVPAPQAPLGALFSLSA